MQLRDYQEECIQTIEAQPPGRYLCQLATGLGKTVIFTHLPRRGRTLLLSHREELVKQPVKYFDCSVGIEMGKYTSHGESVVSASVASMAHRLEQFQPNAFQTIIVDEAHHSAARSYRKILDYFQPNKLVGFTATPNRADGAGLDTVFEKIIFQRDLVWAIRHNWLCDIYCRRVNIGYDLRAVHMRNGDYAPGDLEEAMDGTADAIAEAYRTMAEGATLIFAVSIHQCEEIAARIPGAEIVTGKTKNRAEILERFTRREIPCIVNCMVFTEGTDLPLVETLIIARPTQSDSLYAQMVGRGLRLHPDKKRLNLIDCVGITGKGSLCTAPSLLGVDLSNVPERKREEIQGDLFELPERAVRASDCPESWIQNVEIVDLWAKTMKYNTHDVNWFQFADGSMVCNLPDRQSLQIPPPNALGRVQMPNGKEYEMQELLDLAYRTLQTRFAQYEYIWNLRKVKAWGKDPASEKQLAQVRRLFPELDTDTLTKLQANQILTRMWGRRRATRK